MKEKVVDWGTVCREPQYSIGHPVATSNDRQDSGEGDPGAGQSSGSPCLSPWTIALSQTGSWEEEGSLVRDDGSCDLTCENPE